MRIIAHGIDLVLCSRIERVCEDHGEHFLNRVFTERERAYCEKSGVRITRLSGRFAAKEAVLKALGTGWRGGIKWTDIEVLPDALGKPHVTLSGQTADLAGSLGIGRVLLSISHAGEYAMASAIAISEGA
jgi:holo-[acyl-carrier protein] synthase